MQLQDIIHTETKDFLLVNKPQGLVVNKSASQKGNITLQHLNATNIALVQYCMVKKSKSPTFYQRPYVFTCT